MGKTPGYPSSDRPAEDLGAAVLRQLTSVADRLWPPVAIDRRLHDAIADENDPDRRALLVDALAEIRALQARVSDLMWTIHPDRSGG